MLKLQSTKQFKDLVESNSLNGLKTIGRYLDFKPLKLTFELPKEGEAIFNYNNIATLK